MWVERLRTEHGEVEIRSGSLAEASRVLRDAARWLGDREAPMWTAADLEPAELARVHPECLPLVGIAGGRPVASVLLCWTDPLMWPDAAAGASAEEAAEAAGPADAAGEPGAADAAGAEAEDADEPGAADAASETAEDAGEPGAAGPADAAYIHKLAVTEAYRGTGLASRMLGAAEEVCRRDGIPLMRLDCSADRPKLVQWYLDRGYRAVDRRTVGPHDCMFFEKKLML